MRSVIRSPKKKGLLRLLMGAGLCLPASSGAGIRAQNPPLLPDESVRSLANELSGETAKRNLEGISRFHRQRGSKGFHEAAELVAERLRAYGLEGVEILAFPADGKIFYGTQRSRPAWDAEIGELTETKSGEKLASYQAEPVGLAEDSESAEVTADLVDAGRGTEEADYRAKEVRGKIVLVGAQPGAVEGLAVGKFGAAGIVSYAQNQKTAWSAENQDAVRWGHLETFSAEKTFAFMVSLGTARRLKERLANGEEITLHAAVKAGRHAGRYEVVTATIPGAEAGLGSEEIAFSCHLDHQRPGANDNASGCATILEVARVLKKLVDGKKLDPPGRTIRFVFPPEIEGTLALLAGRPELARRIRAVVHLDMVGGAPGTKAVFHVTRGPLSLPSFVHDVAWSFAEWVNRESYEFAATGAARYPLVSPAGGKEPLRAEYSAYTMGSDHDVYQDSSFGIPAIYMNDWPDRFIHTNFDAPANIDPTKLKRVAFLAAASGYFLARAGGADSAGILEAVKRSQYARSAQALGRASGLSREEGRKLLGEFAESERRIAMSIDRLVPLSLGGDETLPPLPKEQASLEEKLNPAAGAKRYWRRKPEPRGPLAVFGYDYFAEHAKASGLETPKLLSYQGLWGAGEEYAYETLNFANGRSAEEIRDAVSAEYGPVPLALVLEYLQALEKIGLLAEGN
jgi:aminopeptidase YwaD